MNQNKIESILRANFCVGDFDTAIKQLLELKLSYSIVRFRDNVSDDVVCINKDIASEYVKRYNELSGSDDCYVDDDIWLPLDKV